MKIQNCILLVLFTLSSTLAQDGPAKNTLVVHADEGTHTISKHIYGHFAEHLGRCIYGGIWVGPESSIPNTRGIRNDVIKALKEIEIPNLRWPGGCFADTYHWKDGIGPREERPSIINVHWGGETEDNSFGTHEFMDLCELIGCEAYIVGNLGSGSVQEMAEWVEYLTSDAESPMTQLRKKNGREEPWRVRFWGLGNENWGCGGNMTPEYYADLMRRYSTYCRSTRENQLLKIACGPNSGDYHWTETLMKEGRNRWMMQGLALHYYTVMDGWGHRGSATEFGEKEWIYTMSATLRMEDLIRKHATIMDQYDPEKRIGLYIDEWGNWFDVEPGTNPGFLYQQNSLRDALVAAVNLNIFNNHCERVKMANIAQTVNVLQAMILTRDEQMVRTPSFYVYKMFTVHHDATLLPVALHTEDYSFADRTVPALSVSASRSQDGSMHLSIANLNPGKDIRLDCDVRGQGFSDVSGEMLTAEKINGCNDFDGKEEVQPQAFNAFRVSGNKIMITGPSKSVVVLKIK